jgi:hypothetical protein
MYVNKIFTLLEMTCASFAVLLISLCMDAHQCLRAENRGMITQISHLEWPETQKV